jgi:hypothetical protein
MSKHTLMALRSPEVILAQHLRTHLATFLAPLLERLSRRVDVRVVRTVGYVVEALVRLRQRSCALWLTEIGTLLLGAAHAPAGVKRVARLLASPDWNAAEVEQWLLEQADQVVEQEEDVALVALDQSVAGYARITNRSGPMPGPLQQSASAGSSPTRLWRWSTPSSRDSAWPALAGGYRDGLEWPSAPGRLSQLRVRVPPVPAQSGNARVKSTFCTICWPAGAAESSLSGIVGLRGGLSWRWPWLRGHASWCAGPSAIISAPLEDSPPTPGA